MSIIIVGIYVHICETYILINKIKEPKEISIEQKWIQERKKSNGSRERWNEVCSDMPSELQLQ